MVFERLVLERFFQRRFTFLLISHWWSCKWAVKGGAKRCGKTTMEEITVLMLKIKQNRDRETKAAVVKHHLEFMGELFACSFSLVCLLIKKMTPLIKIWPAPYSIFICLCLWLLLACHLGIISFPLYFVFSCILNVTRRREDLILLHTVNVGNVCLWNVAYLTEVCDWLLCYCLWWCSKEKWKENVLDFTSYRVISLKCT